MTFLLPPPRLRKWTAHGREIAARFSVFDVARLSLAPPSAPDRPRDYFVVDCPDWCNVVAVTPEDEVVMVWQYRFGTDALSLETPGGVIDPGEAPLDAVRRELLEETGYAADAFERLASVEANPALQPNRVHTFVARGARRVAPPAPDDDEDLEVVKVPASALAELLDAGVITHALIALALETFLRRGR